MIDRPAFSINMLSQWDNTGTLLTGGIFYQHAVPMGQIRNILDGRYFLPILF